MNLYRKKVLVTGGANGIGRSLVEKLVFNKAIVGVFDIDLAGIKKLKVDLPAVQIWKCDVSNPEQVEKAVSNYIKKNRTIDILVNNAGMVRDTALYGFKKHNIDIWHKVINVNLSSVFYMSRNVVENMIKNHTHGLIINIGSISALGNPGQTAYAAAKAGVNALTYTWAKELAPFNIRVAGISPGFTDTNIIESLSKQSFNNWIKRIPLGRMAKPEEIADGIMFIIHNDYFHGKILNLDGGLIL